MGIAPTEGKVYYKDKPSPYLHSLLRLVTILYLYIRLNHIL
ncbi:hypothetical protein POREN0001_0487 [Porphyromonas endodontalis ATCC 35406]|uniref:Uncharacterized protein n=1 Tax=Porphyromonas endodontalis (strain ATCC 35406 / DSM 24491 / JCM 8526 / CCUG 16442 / BCRC 14492 / NCTC 13058 / HG 370) TaxID=553175 RepID=C3JC87_POREA|nr:hypothetical protein POREN0001_0487 [Porphyromonas endodontalis ATCC 35406]